jgi:plastocyanin
MSFWVLDSSKFAYCSPSLQKKECSQLTYVASGRVVSVPHTVTSDDGFVDQISGPFDSLQQQEQVPGGFLTESSIFEFTFTKVGEYLYHCEPHPWMKGKIKIVENFA